MNYTLALRLVIGWTYFSAFWRRLVLENKLDPEVAGYIGEKFNHFLPHALFIKSQIEYLVTHPDLLWWVMAIFTVVEGIVGLLFMLGLFTRYMSVIVVGLAMGILLSAGWIGTTCLDEWQIGVLGMAGGATIFFFGGDKFSLDSYFKLDRFEPKFLKNISAKYALAVSLLIFLITLGTNQVFHGGVWGTLHNKSVSPELELSKLVLKENEISLDVMRTEGADVYGSFVYKLEVIDLSTNEFLFSTEGEEWQKSKVKVHNHYIAKIKKHDYSLIVPLGAKATLSIPLEKAPTNDYVLRFTDINGKMWSLGSVDVRVKTQPDLLKSGMIIDVREEDEFKEGHLKTAKLHPLSRLESDPAYLNELVLLSQKEPILIYCRTGIRAQKAIKLIEEKGGKAMNIGGYSLLKNLDN